MNENTDPVALARETVSEYERYVPHALGVIVRERFTLARAVIDLTAKVERMEALADRLEREAGALNDSRSGLAVHAGSVKARTVTRIRAALIGETDA